MNDLWLEPRVEMLKQLWAKGLSCSAIADRVNRKFGTAYTRNAVIGKVSRMGLPPRIGKMREDPTTTVRRMRNRKAAMTKAKTRVGNPAVRALFAADGFVPLPEEIVIPIAERKTIQTLGDRDCRWPIGDPQHSDFHFCGRKKVLGLSYCEVHARRAYRPPQARRVANVVRFKSRDVRVGSSRMMPEDADA